MENVKVTRSINISNVVVTPDNIREIATILYEEYKKNSASDDGKNRWKYDIAFTLKSADGIQYQAEDIDVFNRSGLIYTRKITAIDMSYSCTGKEYIDVKLLHSYYDEYYMRNSIEIKGLGETWTNGMLENIKIAISSWKKQAIWPKMIKIPCSILLGLFFGWAAVKFIIEKNITISDKQESAYIYLVCLIAIAGYFLGNHIFKNILRLFPSVELLTGPPHAQCEKIKRTKVAGLLAAYSAPFIVAIIIGILKRFFGLNE